MDGPPWGLVSATTPDGARTAALDVDGVLRSHPTLAGFASVKDVLAGWETLRGALVDLDPTLGEEMPGARRELLIAHPPKVLCSGPNFTDHLAEMGESGLGEAWTPYFFLKPPTTAVIADGADVLIGGDPGEKVDWEGELVAVIGVGGRDIAVDRALEHVAGYCVADDVSWRGPHRRDTPAAPFQWDWLASKGRDASFPMSSVMVPAHLVPDPQALRIITTVDDRTVQDGSTADMVCSVAELVAGASALVTLEPGDVIATGTPAGVGASSGTFLRPGQTVTVTVPGVGRVSSTVRVRDAVPARGA